MPKRNEENKLEVSKGFEIDWPKELDIKPKFEIAVSRTVVARVFDIDFPRLIYREGKQVSEDRLGFAVQFVSKNTGGFPKQLSELRYHSNCSDYGTATVEDLFGLRMLLEQAAYLMRPKTKTVKVSEEFDDE